MDKIIARGAYNTSLAKYDSLKSLDILLDDMSSRRSAGTCTGHTVFYSEAGKLSLGDINSIIAGIKPCTCNAQSYCTGNVVTCDCDSQWSSPCTCEGFVCPSYSVSGCMCEGDYTPGCPSYHECESDYWEPGVCYGGVEAGCTCESRVCTCNADTSCTCNVNSICSCNSHYS